MASAKKPNILVIWGDDIGISNLSCYSNGLMGYQTPNIDRIGSRLSGAIRGVTGEVQGSEEFVIDEADFFQAAMLKVRQGLRHDFVFGEFVDGDMHFGLQNQILKNPPPSAVPVALPGPLLKRVPLEAPNVETNLKYERDPDGVTTDTVHEPSPPTPPMRSTPQVAKRIDGGPGAGFPDTADYYPSQSIRLGEQGVSTVRVCADAKGRLTSDPTTLKGSGIARLDEGALKLARAGSGHYRAATEDGQPVSSCYSLGIRFQLKN